MEANAKTAAVSAPRLARAKGRCRPSARRTAAIMVVLVVLMALVFFVSLALGRYDFDPQAAWALLFGAVDGADAEAVDAGATSLYVMLRLRLPRVLAALCVGAMLASAGCAYQGLFRNPMVSPDLLGASAGAGFGAALGILLSLGGAGVQLSAFAFGLLAVFASYMLAQRFSRNMQALLVLVLCGMVVQQLFMAFTSAVKFVADPNSQLPEITFWLMGGLANAKLDNLAWLIVPMCIGVPVLWLLRWRLNIMSLGDEEAQMLGTDVRKMRLVIVAAATLVTSSAVSVAGMVGWVGLIIPHLARFLVGPDHRVLLPASFLMGASFLMMVDDVCRCVYTTEIPISILTAIIGAPLFIYLISRTGKRAE